MIHKRVLQEREKHILKVWATPRLRELNFRKQGNIYVRTFGRVQHLLERDTHHINTAEEYNFTITCGVHVTGILPVIWGRPEPPTSTSAALIDARPAMLIPPYRDKWWELKATDNAERDNEVGAELASLIETAVLPFFGRFQSERDVAQFLEGPRERNIFPYCASQAVSMAGVIWDQLGEYEKCKAAMAHAAELAKGKRVEAAVEKFAREYVCGKATQKPT